MAEHNAVIFDADTTRRFHKFFLFDGQNLSAHKARHAHPIDNSKSGKQQDQSIHELPDKCISQGNHDDDKE